MTAPTSLFAFAVSGSGQVERPEYPLQEDGETVDMLVLTAIYNARNCPGPVAYSVARAHVFALGGDTRQADLAEHFVRKATGITA